MPREEDLLSGRAKARLIAAAAEHFAEHGFEGASQRAIQRDAGVNSAAVHYYFGSKAALYRGVVEAFLSEIQAVRGRRLAEVPAELTGRDRLRALVRAYVSPHLELAATPRGRPYGRILARVLIEPPTEPAYVFQEIVQPLRRRYLDELSALFPDAPALALAQAVSSTVALMAAALYDTTWPSLTGQDPAERDAATWVEAVTAFVSGGVEAVCGPPAGLGR